MAKRYFAKDGGTLNTLPTVALDAIIGEEDRVLAEKRQQLDRFFATETIRTIAVPSPGEPE